MAGVPKEPWVRFAQMVARCRCLLGVQDGLSFVEGRSLGNRGANSYLSGAALVIPGVWYLDGDQGPNWILYDGLYSPVLKHGSRSRALLRVFEWLKLECGMKVSGGSSDPLSCECSLCGTAA
jgi:hypothetical protein